MVKKIIKLLITIFLGVFGVHKFMEGKKGLGILYLCTFGVFMIGWIIDIIKQTSEIIKELKLLPIPNTLSQKNDKLKSSQTETENNVIQEAKSKKELEKKEFISEVETRDYSSERIQEIIDGYIKNDYFDKDELYDGLENDEIFDITYQLPNTSFACDIEEFEDSGKYGVYMKDYNDNNVFIGCLPKEKDIEFRKITLFGKDIKGGLTLKGGKYKIFDDNKQKIINKKEEFTPTIKMIYYIEDETLIDEKMQEILKEEKDFADNYFIVSTYIAGKNYNNSDGSSRMEYISKLKENDLLLLEEYLYEGEKAVRILTLDKKEIGNVPRDDLSMVCKALDENKLEKVEFKPRWYNGSITDYRINIIIKK